MGHHHRKRAAEAGRLSRVGTFSAGSRAASAAAERRAREDAAERRLSFFLGFF